jgi:hypothetical protein
MVNDKDAIFCPPKKRFGERFLPDRLPTVLGGKGCVSSLGSGLMTNKRQQVGIILSRKRPKSLFVDVSGPFVDGKSSFNP